MGTLLGVALACVLFLVREQGRGCGGRGVHTLGAEARIEPGWEGSVLLVEAQLAGIAGRALDPCGLSLLSP